MSLLPFEMLKSLQVDPLTSQVLHCAVNLYNRRQKGLRLFIVYLFLTLSFVSLDVQQGHRDIFNAIQGSVIEKSIPPWSFSRYLQRWPRPIICPHKTMSSASSFLQPTNLPSRLTASINLLFVFFSLPPPHCLEVPTSASFSQ